jgi:predicted transcriptional regulator
MIATTPTAKTAGDVMTTPVLSVHPDMTVRELATFFADHQISGAPVIDPTHHVVGVVSTTDLAQGELDEAELAPCHAGPEGDLREWQDRMDREDLRHLHVEQADRTVEDIMTPAVYTVRDDAPVAMLARTMVAGRVHRLFVTRGGRIVGIVTSLDLLKLLYEA